MHVRMLGQHGVDAHRRGHQHQRADFLAAGLLQQVDGGDHGAAGGQHGIDDQRQTLVQLADQAFQVGMGFEGFLVAGHAHHADLGAGDQAQHAIQHADAGAQDGHHGDFLAGDLLDLDLATPAFDGGGRQRQILDAS